MAQDKRFLGLNARERYDKEYRENRVFNSYRNSNWDFRGDPARKNAYRSWCEKDSAFVGWLNPDSLRKFLYAYPRAAICPNGHTGYEFVLVSDPHDFDDNAIVTRTKFLCELCGTVWWENIYQLTAH